MCDFYLLIDVNEWQVTDGQLRAFVNDSIHICPLAIYEKEKIAHKIAAKNTRITGLNAFLYARTRTENFECFLISIM